MKISDVSLNECGGFYHHGCARSVSWNSTGDWLALGGPSPRIWSVERAPTASASNGQVRCSEVLVISGHNAATDRVRFHPNESNCLCTSAMDGTVRVWDIRAGTERSVGIISVQSGKGANYVDWCSSNSGAGSGGGISNSVLAVTERDGSVHVYDARKLSSSTILNRGGRSTNSSQGKPLSSFRIPGVDVDACIFSPNGKHLVAATAARGEMLSDLRIWSWRESSEMFLRSLEDKTQFTVPAHTGPIFSMAFSPDGKRLATGSSDSIVGIWDVATMCCTATISNRLKLIRGVAFSCCSKYLANCNEEDGVAVANASTGESVGTVHLRDNPSGMGSTGGGDEVAFNPVAAHILACARSPSHSSSNQSAAIVIKCRISGGLNTATGSER